MPSIEIFARNFYIVRSSTNTGYWIQLDSSNYIVDSKYSDSSSGTRSWYLTVDGGDNNMVQWVFADAPYSSTPFLVGSKVKIGISGWIRTSMPRCNIGVFFQTQDHDIAGGYIPTRNGYVAEIIKWDADFYTIVRRVVNGTVSNLGITNEGSFSTVHTYFWTIEIERDGATLIAKFYKWTDSSTKVSVRTYNLTDSSFNSGRVGFFYTLFGGTVGSGGVVGNIDYFWVEG